MSKGFCAACNMIENGVKTRIALDHTCGLERGVIPSSIDKPIANVSARPCGKMCLVCTCKDQPQIKY